MMHRNGDVTWWAWALMTFAMIAFWGLLAWVFVTRAARSTRTSTTADSPTYESTPR